MLFVIIVSQFIFVCFVAKHGSETVLQSIEKSNPISHNDAFWQHTPLLWGRCAEA
jgi:hypothetical protein